MITLCNMNVEKNTLCQSIQMKHYRMNKYPSVWFNYDNSLFGLKSDKNEI